MDFGPGLHLTAEDYSLIEEPCQTVILTFARGLGDPKQKLLCASSSALEE